MPPKTANPSRIPAQKYSKRRDVILDHALELFSKRGLEATGLKDIAASLGLTHPALYYYFPSKEQLVFEVVEKAMLGLLEKMESSLEGLPNHAPLRLYTLVKAQVQHELEARAVIPFVNAFLYGPLKNTTKLSPEQYDQMQGMQRSVVQFYQQEVKAGQEQGSFVAGSPTVLAFGVLGIVSYSIFWYRESGSMSADKIAEQLAAQSIRSVSALVDSEL